jgi:cytochrome c biogenesis protein CcmG/thiol:disulfide interchange protein DsbE
MAKKTKKTASHFLRKNQLVLMGIVAFVGVLISVFLLVQPRTERQRYGDMLSIESVPQMPPPLMLPFLDQDQDVLTLDHYRGHMVLVHFFASWCPHCRAEHKLMIEIAKINGLKMIGISVRESAEDVKKWLDANRNPYTAVGLDMSGETAQQWKVKGTPASFLLDRQGRIIYQHQGQLTAAIVQEELTPRIVRTYP